jgi:hypothetical protein
MDVKKKRLVFCICCFLMKGMAVDAQTAWSKQAVSVKAHRIRLDALLELITQKTGVRFSYSPQKIPVQQKISLSIKNKPLGKIIETLSVYAGFNYKLKGKHLVLKKREPVKQTVSKIIAHPLQPVDATAGKNNVITGASIAAVATGVVTDTPLLTIVKAIETTRSFNNARSPDSLASLPKTDSMLVLVLEENSNQYLLLSDEPVETVLSDLRNRHPDYSFFVEGYTRYYPAKYITIKTGKLLRDSLESSSKINYRYTKPVDFVLPALRQEGPPFYFTAGVSADEIFYLNPALRIGIERIYAVVAYNTGTNSSRLEWGLGSSWPLNEQWNFSFNGTLGGVMKKRYYQLFDVQNKLYRLNILTERKIGKGWHISGGLNIQLMESKYFSGGQPIQINAGTDLYVTNLTIIKPPYQLLNTLSSPRTARWQSWVGARFGIFYQVDFSPKPRPVTLPNSF